MAAHLFTSVAKALTNDSCSSFCKGRLQGRYANRFPSMIATPYFMLGQFWVLAAALAACAVAQPIARTANGALLGMRPLAPWTGDRAHCSRYPRANCGVVSCAFPDQAFPTPMALWPSWAFPTPRHLSGCYDGGHRRCLSPWLSSQLVALQTSVQVFVFCCDCARPRPRGRACSMRLSSQRCVCSRKIQDFR